MHAAYLSLAIIVASIVTFSAIAKVGRDPKVVRVIKDVVGVPMEYFPVLAACEFAGALGLIVGVWLPWAGMAAGVGLVIYFVGAVAAHLRVSDIKGIGPAVFILTLCAVTLALRVLMNTGGASR
ncbi:MAG: DoxX family protein [Candidatus Acidiferrales bacterium]